MKQKRWMYLLMGTVVLLLAGFIYAWSVISRPIEQEYPQWSGSPLATTFTISMIFFCLGGMTAGFLARVWNARWNLAISAVLFLIGLQLSSHAVVLPQLYAGYGVCCGTAAGFANNAVLQMVPTWYPEKPAIASGTLLMGFGSSSMVIGSLFSVLTSDVLKDWRLSLSVIGYIMAVIIGSSALFLRPSQREQHGEAAAFSGPEYSLRQVLKEKWFWVIYLWATLLSASGLVLIGRAYQTAQAIAVLAPANVLAVIAGVLSVSNGVGRIIFGAVFDRKGSKKTMFIVNASFLAGLILVAAAQALNSVIILVAAFILTGMGYGGIPTMGASAIRSVFGRKHYAENFAFFNTNLLFASLANSGAAAICTAVGGDGWIVLALAIGAMIAMGLLTALK